MRVISDNPIDLIRSILHKHVNALWVPPHQLASLFDFSTTPTPIRFVYTDISARTEVDVSKLDTRVILQGDEENGSEHSFAVIGELCPVDYQNKPGATLLTASLDVIVAMQSERSVSKDGVIQIFGGEKGIVMFTMQQMRQQRGKKTVRGITLRGFAVERRSAEGVWERGAIKLNVSDGSIREFRIEESDR